MKVEIKKAQCDKILIKSHVKGEKQLPNRLNKKHPNFFELPQKQLRQETKEREKPKTLSQVLYPRQRTARSCRHNLLAQWHRCKSRRLFPLQISDHKAAQFPPHTLHTPPLPLLLRLCFPPSGHRFPTLSRSKPTVSLTGYSKNNLNCLDTKHCSWRRNTWFGRKYRKCSVWFGQLLVAEVKSREMDDCWEQQTWRILRLKFRGGREDVWEVVVVKRWEQSVAISAKDTLNWSSRVQQYSNKRFGLHVRGWWL